jgi:putative ABC transport system substrate-binding protein
VSEDTVIGRRRLLQLAASGVAAGAVPASALAAPLAGANPVAPIAAPTVPAEAKGRKRVLMMLWRGETPVEKGFRDYLKSADVDYDLIVRNAAMSLDKVKAYIAEAKETHPDLVYTWGTEVTRAVLGRYNEVDPAVNITRIPVVFTVVTTPVGAGIVPAMGPSGRNFTGVSHVPSLDVQLNALQAYRPVKRLAVINNPTTRLSAIIVRGLMRACERRGIDLHIASLSKDAQGNPSAASIPGVMQAIARWKPDFLYLSTDSFIAANAAAITGIADQLRIPTFAASEVPLRRGTALCGLVGRYEAVGRMTAYKVLQILRDGIPPGRIPIETLHRFSYIVNMDVAGDLGVYPPLAVLDYAELIKSSS